MSYISSGTGTRCPRVLLTSPDGVSMMYDLGVLADDVTLPLIRSLPPDETHTSVPIGISDLVELDDSNHSCISFLPYTVGVFL